MSMQLSMQLPMQLMLAMADPLEHVLPHPLFGLSWFTNQTAMVVLASLLMLLIFPAMFGKPDSNPPSGVKNAFELILEFLRNEVFRPILKEYTDTFAPFLWTIFFFILFCNLLGWLPIGEIVELVTLGHLQHFGGAATGSLNTTATLAVCAFFFIHFNGLRVLIKSLMDGTYGHHHHEAHHDETVGNLAINPATYEYPAHSHKMSLGEALVKAPGIYLWNFAPHPFKEVGLWADLPVYLFLLALELLGALIKPFALCMRLFGNMVAGHMLLAVLIGLIVSAPTILGQVSVGIPIMVLDLLIQFLELLVVFLQAYIFVFLTALFIGGAVAPEH
jgi:F-type H+-transporting ATPase subunit a